MAYLEIQHRSGWIVVISCDITFKRVWKKYVDFRLFQQKSGWGQHIRFHTDQLPVLMSSFLCQTYQLKTRLIQTIVAYKYRTDNNRTYIYLYLYTVHSILYIRNCYTLHIYIYYTIYTAWCYIEHFVFFLTWSKWSSPKAELLRVNFPLWMEEIPNNHLGYLKKTPWK